MPHFPCLGPIPADRLTVLKSNGETTNGREQRRWRFIPAALFDLALVLIPTAVAVAALRERFLVLPTGDRSPLFSSSDQQRINDIDQVFNRGLRLGDELHTLSGSGWWLTMATLVAATVTVFVAVPALRGRRTPGQHVMGIEADDDSFGEAIEPLVHIDLSDGPAENEPAADSDDEQDGSEPNVGELEDAERAKVGEDDYHDVGPGDDTTHQLPDPFTVTPESERAIERHSVFASNRAEDESLDITEPDEPSITLGTNRQPPATGPTFGASPGRSSAGQITLADESDYVRWDRERANSRRGSGNTLVRSSARPTPTSEPEWSADWQAWMYWDAGSKRWFRHDTGDDRWVPVS